MITTTHTLYHLFQELTIDGLRFDGENRLRVECIDQPGRVLFTIPQINITNCYFIRTESFDIGPLAVVGVDKHAARLISESRKVKVSRLMEIG